MAKEIPWVIEEHTKVKHQLLENYITVWMAIMFSQQARLSLKKRLVYIDGFAGPGVYWTDTAKTESVLGSPVIVAEKANEFIERDNSREVSILAIDTDQRCVNNLEKLLKERNNYAQRWGVTLSTFEETINRVFDNLREANEAIAPAFVFIDPFGYSGFSMNVLKRILAYPRTELFINFNVYDIIRFLEANHATKCMLELFGTERYQEAATRNGDEKVSFLTDLYCKQLKALGNNIFVQPFRVNTSGQGTRPRYFLIHASSNIKALKEMKNAMAKSSTQPFRFEAVGLDPHIQMDFFAPTGEEILKNQIYEFIHSHLGAKISYEEVENWSYQATGGIARDIKKALISLEGEKRIKIVRMPRQKTNTVTDGAVVLRE